MIEKLPILITASLDKNKQDKNKQKLSWQQIPTENLILDYISFVLPFVVLDELVPQFERTSF